MDFSPTFFSNNRERLVSIVKADLIVLTANGQLQRNSDCVYPFRQDSNFWYLTGLDIADAVVVIDGKNAESFIIVPDRSEYELLFDSSLSSTEITKISGIKIVESAADGWQKLSQRLKNIPKVATITPPPAFIDVYSMHTNPSKQVLADKLALNGCSDLIDIREQLASMRIIKQTEEISALRQAIDITCDTFEDVRRNLSQYKNEREIEADLTAGYRKRGATGHGFSPIVASGLNAFTLHYLANEADLSTGEFVLLDSGAEVSNYSADISRTYPIGDVSERFKEIYTAVYEAQLAGIAQMKPGNVFQDADDALCDSLEKSLKRLRLQPIDGQSLLRSYYPHTSHHMGLDVHDVGDRKQELAPGMVITMEPGIYIQAEKLGVRLEDDILITKDGCENLSQKLPVSPVDILGVSI